MVEDDAEGARPHFDGLKETKEGMHSQLQPDGPPTPSPSPAQESRFALAVLAVLARIRVKGSKAVIDRRRVCFFRRAFGI